MGSGLGLGDRIGDLPVLRHQLAADLPAFGGTLPAHRHHGLDIGSDRLDAADGFGGDAVSFAHGLGQHPVGVGQIGVPSGQRTPSGLERLPAVSRLRHGQDRTHGHCPEQLTQPRLTQATRRIATLGPILLIWTEEPGCGASTTRLFPIAN